MQKMPSSKFEQQTLISVEDVSKVYAFKDGQNIQALCNICLKVPKGTGLALVGPNGCGKSTLLRLIAGISKPTSGRIVSQGKVAALIDPGAGFHPELNGWENLYFYGRLSGLSDKEIRRLSVEIIEFSGISNFLHRPLKYYSHGMYLRLAFSAAVFMPYDILLIDEILAVGDLQFQQRCIAKLLDLKEKEGRTFVIVSHQTQLLYQLCEYGVWLEKGMIKKTGTLDNVLEEYYTAQLSVENAHYESQFIDIQMVEWDRKPSVYHTGEPALLSLKLAISEVMENIQLRINVFDIKENFITHLDPGLKGDSSLNFKPGKATVQVHLPALDFFPGNYFLRVSVYDNRGLISRIMRIAHFHIINNSWNKMVNAHTTIRTGVFLKHQFSIIPLGE
ncbi:hypothetical protein AT05_11885 [Schleiferia thermophila str. Yellowstone]|nr:hypothetical protein AT05_11885 [Schleiferia thermophila str. Yellowstone]